MKGGHDAAKKAYEEHVESKQPESVVPSDQEDENEKQTAVITSEEE